MHFVLINLNTADYAQFLLRFFFLRRLYAEVSYAHNHVSILFEQKHRFWLAIKPDADCCLMDHQVLFDFWLFRNVWLQRSLPFDRTHEHNSCWFIAWLQGGDTLRRPDSILVQSWDRVVFNWWCCGEAYFSQGASCGLSDSVRSWHARRDRFAE